MKHRANLTKVLKNLTKIEKIIIIALAVIIVVGIIIVLTIKLGNKDTEDVKDVVEITDEDPLEYEAEKKQEKGVEVDIAFVVDESETKEVTNGIDVSRYQGTIDWEKVAGSGIDFAMIRVGYRTLSSGEIVADSNAKYNMQEAQKYGIKLGAYFFSTAISEEEAKEEANWVADYIGQYKITYPVAYNCENFEREGSRQYHLTKEERTEIALAFMDRIEERGYRAMFYAAKGEMEGNAAWEMERISSLYKVWVAQYPEQPFPVTSTSSYSGTYAMWQYTNKGTVPGIDALVDANVAYFGYTEEKDAQNIEKPEEIEADVEALMNFKTVEEKVTAKDKTNLRDKPSQGNDSKVIVVLKNGEYALRTGVSDSGWSRVEVDGIIYYAVSNYLTTDLNYKPAQEEPDDGIETEFRAIEDRVTAKEVVNLRNIPSVTREDSVIVAYLKNGEVVTRTGINNEMGWSRVDYNGKTLYCISSYLKIVENE